ncbi:MAG: hypothetical protein DRQ47_05230 [Gammaproteobacteria bacterium]|nr:MAG: hypothetical protein DRQ47_05230 [Gammaproteobacteria bacterium]
MKRIYFTMLIFIFIVFTQLISIEQSKDFINLSIPDSTQVQIITINDGSSFLGRIIKIGEEKIKFETKYGVMTISVFEREI